MLTGYLSSTFDYIASEKRIGGVFKGMPGLFTLLQYAWKHARADINITVQRMAIPVILSSMLFRKKAVVVFHHYDRTEQLSLFYHINAWFLFRILSAGLSNVRVAVVADFWKDFLIRKGIAADAVLIIPNLFDPGKYHPFRTRDKIKQVYFGQYSSKQHEDVFELIGKLNNCGYSCFFTTPDERKAKKEKNYEVFHLPFNEYAAKIAESVYTVCLSSFNEGWNRTAHESILLGTPVIGNNKGGLGELLAASGQLCVSTADEVFDAITKQKNAPVNPDFENAYHIDQISYYAEPIIEFCKG